MHKKYIDQLCEDFESKMKDMITESIAEHKVAETDNLLYVEVVQHTLFCKKKIEVVYGRKSTLKVLVCVLFKSVARIQIMESGIR